MCSNNKAVLRVQVITELRHMYSNNKAVLCVQVITELQCVFR